MKLLIINLCLSLFVSMPSIANDVIELGQVAQKVSKENFTVRENAGRVYQSKQNIKFARGNLLPKLNLWNILKLPSIILDPLSAVDILQDIAPFLVPANWFAAKQAKVMAEIQETQYNAVWGNEIATAKTLFVSVSQNQNLTQILREKSAMYEEYYKILKIKGTFGGVDPIFLQSLKTRALSLQEDALNLEQLTYDEVKEIQYLMGVPQEKDISLGTVVLPNPSEANKLDPKLIYPAAITKSPEIQQYDLMQKSLKHFKKRVMFNILGVSTFSLGSGAGAFDHIPIQDGLGFGQKASIEISKAEGEILRIQKQASSETIKKQIFVFSREYNQIIENYDLYKEIKQSTEDNLKAMKAQILLGKNPDPAQFLDVLDQNIEAELNLMMRKYRLLSLNERFQRMQWTGDYTNPKRPDFWGNEEGEDDEDDDDDDDDDEDDD